MAMYRPGDASFAADIAGVELTNFQVSTVQPGIWTTNSGEALIATAGEYLVSFVFNTMGGDAKDIVIDRAYVVSDQNGGGLPVSVPEPSSAALMLGGLGLIGCAVARRKRGSGAVGAAGAAALIGA